MGKRLALRRLLKKVLLAFSSLKNHTSTIEKMVTMYKTAVLWSHSVKLTANTVVSHGRNLDNPFPLF